MMLLRRRFLAGMGAFGAAALLGPQRVWASAQIAFGDVRIDTLSDGNLMLPADFILGGMPEEELKVVVEAFGLSRDQLTPPCNVTLLRDGTHTVLFDVGAGPDFQPSAGKLAEALNLLDVPAEDVTHVVFTHAHPDHLWGVLDEFDEPVFVNAAHLIGRTEFDYWTNPDTVASIDSARTTFAVGAARRLSAMVENLTLLEDGADVLPGVIAHLTPGHTPGHMSFRVGEGKDAVMVVGDAIGNHHVAFVHPEWKSGSDQDAEMAARTRMMLLDDMARDKTAIIGFHLPDGGIGRVEKEGQGYRFVAGA
ncbi:MBL fold metallo-hydrolase [Rhizobium sp. AAP116]|uniref:MBL fold metallo-hydrolase n=1 Tax=Rhizobium sp. AAP116 TaxID=1523429 RepID=UPI0006B8F809|nr:MBL fold metallo-hydrolase [Rhizobium sp. AAP116]KPF61085.1 MBL fold metallo-hydrolase [Rhizobium sp. AAP116]